MLIPVSETKIRSTFSFRGTSGFDGRSRKFLRTRLIVDFISSIANLMPEIIIDITYLLIFIRNLAFIMLLCITYAIPRASAERNILVWMSFRRSFHLEMFRVKFIWFFPFI